MAYAYISPAYVHCINLIFGVFLCSLMEIRVKSTAKRQKGVHLSSLFYCGVLVGRHVQLMQNFLHVCLIHYGELARNTGIQNTKLR